MSEVKKINEFIAQSGVQFDIILRRESGESFNFHVKGPEEFPEILDYKETIFSTHEHEGIIRIIKRVCDDSVFHQSDIVEIEGVGTCFIVEFCEDLIHCFVVDLDNTKRKVEVNNLIEVVSEERGEAPEFGLDSLSL